MPSSSSHLFVLNPLGVPFQPWASMDPFLTTMAPTLSLSHSDTWANRSAMSMYAFISPGFMTAVHLYLFYHILKDLLPPSPNLFTMCLLNFFSSLLSSSPRKILPVGTTDWEISSSATTGSSVLDFVGSWGC